MSIAARWHLSILVTSVLLFVCLLPILDWWLFAWTHPASVLTSNYDPLILRLPAFYSHNVLNVSRVTACLLFLLLAFLIRYRGFTFGKAIFVLILPFALAITFQYAVIVQLDKHIVSFFSGGGFVPLEILFDGAIVTDCLRLFVVYASIITVLYLIICRISGVAASVLTRR